jgi:cytochrome c peroxidase
VVFDGPGECEDFGLEQVNGNVNYRYAFRTSPLRNLALQPAFFHNGAVTRLEDALRYHLDAIGSAPFYKPVTAGVAKCRDCHARAGAKPRLMSAIPTLRDPATNKITNLDAKTIFHSKCDECHAQLEFRMDKTTAPRLNNCVTCHMRAANELKKKK